MRVLQLLALVIFAKPVDCCLDGQCYTLSTDADKRTVIGFIG
jgi:hypothetical protein